MRTLSLAISIALFVLGCGGSNANGEGTATGGVNAQRTQNGGTQNGNELRAGFMQGCREECARGGVLSDCPGYCDCMYQRMEADGFERRAAQLQSHPESVSTDPFFTAGIAACGPDAIVASFVDGCVSEDPALRPTCVCMVEHLCEGRTAQGCAQWILDNPSYPANAEETAQLQRSAEHCRGL